MRCLADGIKELFNWAFENGFGADSSTGKGNVSILDVAPTISDILGIGVQPEWEGTSILKK